MINTKINSHQIPEIPLAKYKLWIIEGDRRGDVISCLSGLLWITQDGDLKDYILEAGRSFWVTRPGTVVIQALDDSQFRHSLNELGSQLKTARQPQQRLPKTRVNHALR